MEPLSVANITIEVIIALAATVGNILIILIIYRDHRLHNNTTYFIANLAFADLMVGVIGIPSAILTAEGLPRQFQLCIIMISLIIAMTQVSIFGMLVIATEKFIALWKPFFYQKYSTPKSVLCVIIVTWVAGLAVGMVPLFGWNLGWPSHHRCFFEEIIDMQYMVFFNFFVCVLLPLTATVGIYSYVLSVVHRQNRQIASLQIDPKPEPNKNGRSFNKDFHAARCLTPLIICFAICWLPIHVINSLTLLCTVSCDVPLLLKISAIWLSHLNSAINPILYTYRNEKFKNAFRHVFYHRTNSEIETVNVAVTRRSASVMNNAFQINSNITNE